MLWGRRTLAARSPTFCSRIGTLHASTTVVWPHRPHSGTASTPDATTGNGEDSTLSSITAAGIRIRGDDKVNQTSCSRSARFSELLDCNVFFKREYEHRTGSFKERGARNVLECLSPEQKAKGVIAASAGNHALALAYHGRAMGIPVTVIMPSIAPLTKVQKCEAYGARVVIEGEHLLESRVVADAIGEEEGLTYVNGYDDKGIIDGTGTIGLEILAQCPDVDCIVVPVGGGGLIAGIAIAVKSILPHVEIIGVEPALCPSWSNALAAGAPVTVDMKGRSTLADGLAVTSVGPRAFRLGAQHVDEMLLVDEKSIALAVLRLLENERCVVEGGGVAGLAAMLDPSNAARFRGKNVVVPLCGSNVDTPVLGRVIERGLAADGRIHRLRVWVSDRPGGIASLTALISSVGVSVKDVHHERAWVYDDVSSVAITTILETRNAQHALQLQDVLDAANMQYKWTSL